MQILPKISAENVQISILLDLVISTYPVVFLGAGLGLGLAGLLTGRGVSNRSRTSGQT